MSSQKGNQHDFACIRAQKRKAGIVSLADSRRYGRHHTWIACIPTRQTLGNGLPVKGDSKAENRQMVPLRRIHFLIILLAMACQAPPKPAAKKPDLPPVKVDISNFECDNEWAYQLEGRTIDIVGYLHPNGYMSCGSQRSTPCFVNLRKYPTPNLHIAGPYMRIWIPFGTAPNQVNIPASDTFTATQVTFYDYLGQPFNYTRKVSVRGTYKHNPYSEGYHACNLMDAKIRQL
ncbi:MAG: hypothetical protein CMN76_04030 [Spirochaetaceae bacterium]|nr:hypothetical protein [Spirochaetaceae bacterium]